MIDFDEETTFEELKDNADIIINKIISGYRL